MSIKIHITYIQGAHLREYEKMYVPQLKAELQRNLSQANYILEPEPACADVIILWEGFEYKTPEYLTVLESDPLIRRHADRVYAINYDDHPEGFLAGAYTSLEHPFFDPVIHRIWPFFVMNNPVVYTLTSEEVLKPGEKYLFSFTGAASHAIRKKLFSHFAKPHDDYHVEHVKRWYDHDEAHRRSFTAVAMDSVFCLCPHGYCSYTPRITEVMAMARVPVIIADDWIPFSFEEEVPYYIRVPEKDIEHLPEILSGRRGEVEDMRRNARMLWEKYLSIDRRALALVECVARLAERPNARPTFESYRARWHSQEFQQNLGWTAAQRLALRLEQHVRRWFPNVRIPRVSNLMRYRNAPNLK